VKDRAGGRGGEGGVDGVKNRSGKCEGPGRRGGRGGTNGCLKRKVLKKNQKHEPRKYLVDCSVCMYM
jgi:hypothetical protein